jgi:hypothetical protein
LEVGKFKNCMRLWRKAHSEVKMLKPLQVRGTLGNEAIKKVHAAVARSPLRSQRWLVGGGKVARLRWKIWKMVG